MESRFLLLFQRLVFGYSIHFTCRKNVNIGYFMKVSQEQMRKISTLAWTLEMQMRHLTRQNQCVIGNVFFQWANFCFIQYCLCHLGFWWLFLRYKGVFIGATSSTFCTYKPTFQIHPKCHFLSEARSAVSIVIRVPWCVDGYDRNARRLYPSAKTFSPSMARPAPRFLRVVVFSVPLLGWQ